MRHLDPAEAERRSARRLCYRPLAGWTWRRIAEARAGAGHPPRMFPLAEAGGCVGWGVPIAHTPPRAQSCRRLEDAARFRRSCSGHDAAQLVYALNSVLWARRLRLTGSDRSPASRSATNDWAVDLATRLNLRSASCTPAKSVDA